MPHLDALRAYAVLAVMYAHWVPQQHHANLPLGAMGVELFFVLSGFLISGILLRARDSNGSCRVAGVLVSFYVRRALRIFPLYYVVLAGLLVVSPPVRRSILWHACYLSNVYFFLQDRWFGLVAHFWSLAVEEQFYLIWPSLLLFVSRRRLWVMVASVTAVGFACRLGLALAMPQRHLTGILLVSNLDALGLGALLALGHHAAGARARRFAAASLWALAPFGVLCWPGLSVLIAETPIATWVRHSFMLMGFLGLVASAANGWRAGVSSVLASGPILYLGRISYGLYLLHNLSAIPVNYIAGFVVGPMSLPLVLLLKAGFTVGGAALSWHFLERPLNRLKNAFPYQRDSAAVARVAKT